MKQSLVVSFTEVKAITPKLVTEVRTVSFSDVEKGRKFAKENAQKVFHTQLVERED